MIEPCFRAKRIDNSNWIYGYYACFGYTGNMKEVIIPLYASELYAIIIDPDTVSRWTGLSDSNRNPIYENDIVTIDEEDGYFLICYNDDNAAYYATNNGDILTFAENIYGRDCTVVGNRYDNQNLMEGEDE